MSSKSQFILKPRAFRFSQKFGKDFETTLGDSIEISIITAKAANDKAILWS